MNAVTTTGPVSTGEPRLAASASWAVLAASFGLSAATWIAMARLAGFSTKLRLPLVDVTADLAWLMPVAVDGYVVVALVLWMAPVPAKVAAFARVNTYAAAGIGVAAQSAYHALTVWSNQPTTGRTVWQPVLAAVVGALPPAVAGLAVHMRALIRRESRPTIPAPAVTAPDRVEAEPAPVSASASPVTETAPATPPMRPVTSVPVDANPPTPAEPAPSTSADPIPVAAESTPAGSVPSAPDPVPAGPVPPAVVAPARPPATPTPVGLVETARPGLLAPVTPAAFVRRNGTPLTREVTR